MKAKIKSKKEVAEDTLEVDFDLLGNTIDFEPGEFFNIDLIDPPYNDDKGHHRHFSIVNSPNEKGIITMVTRERDSAFKQSLADMEPGSEVEIGKIGGKDFTLPEDTGRPLVFIAGGIGIAPFISMIRYAMEEGIAYDIILMYSNRNRESAIFLDELEERAAGNVNLDIILIMTDDPSWEGETRRIDAGLIADYVEDPTSRTYMIAGPPGMNKGIASELEKLAVPKENIMASNFAGY
ncbi:MAG: FAD-dependent oxidoreductase [Actinobacteria bacterium]|nr:FAD-dependent oxidoreductase [Actinomycetota bacterium]